MSRRPHSYPDLEDPRAAMAELVAADQYVLSLQRRFYISTPAYQVLAEVRAALRAAALHLTNDPHFFGLPPTGQSAYRPPPAPPAPPAPPMPGR